MLLLKLYCIYIYMLNVELAIDNYYYTSFQPLGFIIMCTSTSNDEITNVSSLFVIGVCLNMPDSREEKMRKLLEPCWNRTLFQISTHFHCLCPYAATPITPMAYTGNATALKNILSAFFASFIAFLAFSLVPAPAQFRRWKTDEKEHWIARL